MDKPSPDIPNPDEPNPDEPSPDEASPDEPSPDEAGSSDGNDSLQLNHASLQQSTSSACTPLSSLTTPYEPSAATTSDEERGHRISPEQDDDKPPEYAEVANEPGPSGVGTMSAEQSSSNQGLQPSQASTSKAVPPERPKSLSLAKISRPDLEAACRKRTISEPRTPDEVSSDQDDARAEAKAKRDYEKKTMARLVTELNIKWSLAMQEKKIKKIMENHFRNVRRILSEATDRLARQFQSLETQEGVGSATASNEEVLEEAPIERYASTSQEADEEDNPLDSASAIPQDECLEETKEAKRLREEAESEISSPSKRQRESASHATEAKAEKGKTKADTQKAGPSQRISKRCSSQDSASTSKGQPDKIQRRRHSANPAISSALNLLRTFPKDVGSKIEEETRKMIEALRAMTLDSDDMPSVSGFNINHPVSDNSSASASASDTNQSTNIIYRPIGDSTTTRTERDFTTLTRASTSWDAHGSTVQPPGHDSADSTTPAAIASREGQNSTADNVENGRGLSVLTSGTQSLHKRMAGLAERLTAEPEHGQPRDQSGESSLQQSSQDSNVPIDNGKGSSSSEEPKRDDTAPKKDEDEDSSSERNI